jgi:hypothetical protein
VIGSGSTTGDNLVLFTGRFGSGKTEAAINYALDLTGRSGSAASETATRDNCGFLAAQSLGVILVDLDIVTPYFRSRETAEAMAQRGVQVVAPAVVGQHLHIPAITPQILGAIQQTDRPTVLDVGGDRQGARALGQFSGAIRERGYTLHFVVNPYRPFTETLEGLASSIAEIEASARLQVTDLVSNPNLMRETTRQQIVDGHAKIERFARELDLPIAFVCIERRWLATFERDDFAQPILPLDRFFVMSWE